MSGRLRIFIVEPHRLVSDALTSLLEPEFEVVGQIDRVDGAAAAVDAAAADVAMVDSELPGPGAIEATTEIASRAPHCKVLLITAQLGPGHVQRGLQAGASGVISKASTGNCLVQSIHVVAQGGTAVDPEVAAAAVRLGGNPLSEREAAILRLVGKNATTQEIADELNLSPGTVRNYVSGMLSKLEVSSRVLAFQRAVAMGWV